MKNHIIRTPIIFLTLLLCCRCTVEKRLYNRGFHVEWNQAYSSARASFERPSCPIVEVPEIADELVEGTTITPLDNLSQSVGGDGEGNKQTFDIVPDPSETDTLTIQSDHSSTEKQNAAKLTQLEKREGLIASAAATLLFGLGAVGVIHLAVTSPTAGLILLLGPVGLLLGIIAVCFFILFLVYLCLPTEVSRDDRVARSGIKERKFSRGERVGLVFAGIFAFVILIAFTLPLVNG